MKRINPALVTMLAAAFVLTAGLCKADSEDLPTRAESDSEHCTPYARSAVDALISINLGLKQSEDFTSLSQTSQKTVSKGVAQFTFEVLGKKFESVISNGGSWSGTCTVLSVKQL